jgi:hypothetical protein
MAEITTIGLVRCVSVGNDFGLVEIAERVTNQLELFIIWLPLTGQPSASERLLQIVQESLLREALTNRLQVQINHEEDSAYIDALEVDAPTGP